MASIPDPTYASKVARARQTPPEQKILDGPQLFASVCRRMKEGIRMQFPDADEARVHEILLERLAIAKKLENLPCDDW